MGDLAGLGRLLLAAGLALAAVGLVLLLAPRLPMVGWFGRLPGDFVFRRGEATVFVPLATSILLSLLLTLALNLIFRR